MRAAIIQYGLPAMLLAGLLAADGAQARTMYITDEISAGLHEERAPDSPVIETLATGSELEVLEQADGRARVRTGDGTAGWIDADYLSAEQPARQQLAAIESELESARADLARLRSHVGDSEALAEQKRLRQSRDRLEQELAAARERAAELANRQPQPHGPTATVLDWLEQRGPQLRYLGAALVLALIIGVLLGGWLVDYRHRRRHGGFRL